MLGALFTRKTGFVCLSLFLALLANRRQVLLWSVTNAINLSPLFFSLTFFFLSSRASQRAAEPPSGA